MTGNARTGEVLGGQKAVGRCEQRIAQNEGTREARHGAPPEGRESCAATDGGQAASGEKEVPSACPGGPIYSTTHHADVKQQGPPRPSGGLTVGTVVRRVTRLQSDRSPSIRRPLRHDGEMFLDLQGSVARISRVT